MCLSYLFGHVCRATLVGGVLAGFYKSEASAVVGDGKKTIKELMPILLIKIMAFILNNKERYLND
jgi:hypothetical protein